MIISAALAFLGSQPEDTSQDTCRTLEECISIGISEGFEVRRSRIGLREAQDAAKLSVLDMLPSLQISGTHQWGWVVDEKPVGDKFLSAEAGLNLNGLAGGILMRQSRSTAIQSARAMVEDAALQTAITITGDYLNLLLAMQSRKNADSSLVAIQLLRDKTAIEVDVGKTSRGTLAEIEAQVASEKAELVNAQGEQRSAAMALASDMNLPPDSGVRIVTPQDAALPELNELPGEMAISRYLNRHPEIKSARADVEGAKKESAAAITALLPRIEVGWSHNACWPEISKNVSSSVGVTLAIPILNGSSYHLQALSAKTQIARKELDAEETRRKLEVDIRSDILDAISSYENFQACRENLNAMEISFHICEAKFGAGAISGSDYITSRKNFLDAQAKYWRARYYYIFRMKIIDLKMHYEKIRL